MTSALRLAVVIAAVSVLAGCVSSTRSDRIPMPLERVPVDHAALDLKAAPGEIVAPATLRKALTSVAAAKGGFGLHVPSAPQVPESELVHVPRRTAKADRGTPFHYTFWVMNDGSGWLDSISGKSGKRYAAPAYDVQAEDGSEAFTFVPDRSAYFTLHLTVYMRENGGLACLDHAPRRVTRLHYALRPCEIVVPG